MSYCPIPPDSGKKRGRTAEETEIAATTTTTTPTTVMTAGGGLATKNWNFMASAPLSVMPVPTMTMPTTAIATTHDNIGSSTSTTIGSSAKQEIPKKAANTKSKSKSKEDMLASLGLLPDVNKIRVKSCDPTAGLTLGGVPVSPEQLASLTPMDLDEHILMRNGVPLEIDELARLLGMEEEFDEDAFALDETSDEDELILGMIENGMLDLFLQNMGD